MKKEILNLVKSEEGILRLNNISFLRRWTKDALNNPVDKLVIEFDSINHVRYSLYERDIESRDFEGIIKECEEKTHLFLTEVSNVICSNLRNGYNYHI